MLAIPDIPSLAHINNMMRMYLLLFLLVNILTTMSSYYLHKFVIARTLYIRIITNKNTIGSFSSGVITSLGFELMDHGKCGYIRRG